MPELTRINVWRRNAQILNILNQMDHAETVDHTNIHIKMDTKSIHYYRVLNDHIHLKHQTNQNGILRTV
jgi:hypothetical protein